MAPDADLPIPGSEAETPPSKRRGIGLCLSGGGFRATLFHLGAIQRLFELGIATRPDFDTVASVSGGSLTSAQWAIAEAQAKAESRSIDFARDIARPLQALTSRDLRTGALAQKFLLPWNWFRGGFVIDSSAKPALGAWSTGSKPRSAKAR
jgi:NTE family protein